jgi:hypothetical protein
MDAETKNFLKSLNAAQHFILSQEKPAVNA